MNNKINIHPFNNSIETGLRTLALLNAAFPKAYDLDMLVYFDYLTVHSGDIEGGLKSLHPAVPNRTGEIFVRRTIIEEGLEVFISRGLAEKIFSKNGIEYKASENSTPFLESLSEQYVIELSLRANWVIEKFSLFDRNEMKNFIFDNIDKWKQEFNLEIFS